MSKAFRRRLFPTVCTHHEKELMNFDFFANAIDPCSLSYVHIFFVLNSSIADSFLYRLTPHHASDQDIVLRSLVEKENEEITCFLPICQTSYCYKISDIFFVRSNMSSERILIEYLMVLHCCMQKRSTHSS